MHHIIALDSIDYLVIGHITRDLTPAGPRPGGTAAYAALTAKAMGLRVGIITSWGSEFPASQLQEIPIINLPAEASTTFENVSTPEGRVQFIQHTAPALSYNLVPEVWYNSPIVHLGPVAQEVEPALVRNFPSALIGVTPQGWLRTWDKKGRVSPGEWPEANFVLQRAGAAVISVDDVNGDEARIEELASSTRILAVTEGEAGSRLYWNGDVRRFRAPEVPLIDDTGAGDIYAAAFFVRLFTTRDPWEAARFATQIAAYSITRPGIEGVPTQEEIESCMVEIL